MTHDTVTWKCGELKLYFYQSTIRRRIKKMRLLAIVDRPVWEKVSKGRVGTMWDRVIEKVWKDIGGNQEEVMSAGK